jgi:myo-inositol-1(or 4)-monophosphatase
MPTPLSIILNLLQQLAPQVAAMQANDLNVKSKGKNDLVTKADLFADQFLTTHLSQIYPNNQFLTEESVPNWRVEKKDFSPFSTLPKYWLIDPIDGTANYVRGNHNYAISIALIEQGQVTLGAIARPAYKEIYYATLTKGAFLLKNNTHHRLHTSSITCLDEARIALEATGRQTLRPIYLPLVLKLFPHVGEHYNLLSSVTHWCLLAQSEIDGAQSAGYPWDMAAGALIVQEAGGIICQLNGQPWHPLAPDGLFCANAKLQQAILTILQNNHNSSPYHQV